MWYNTRLFRDPTEQEPRREEVYRAGHIQVNLPILDRKTHSFPFPGSIYFGTKLVHDRNYYEESTQQNSTG